MEVAFDTKQLRDLCESQKNAERRMNISAAEALRSCFADIMAAANVDEFRLVRPTSSLRGDGAMIDIPLADGYRLRFCQNHIECPKLANGSISWSTVTRVKIMGVDNA